MSFEVSRFSTTYLKLGFESSRWATFTPVGGFLLKKSRKIISACTREYIPSSFSNVILTVDEKYLESSLVFPPLTQEAISSITSFMLANPIAITKHIIPANPIFLINLIPITFTVTVYSNIIAFGLQPLFFNAN